MEVSHYYNTASSNTESSATLATRLGDMLYKAEEKYGRRDLSWTVLGVEFGSDGPHIWFPKPGKNVVITLGPTALNDTVNACYQLAHECIHLLSPCGFPVVPVIEEGLATVFSETYIAELGVSYSTDDVPYAEAAALVRELLSIDADAIIKLRAVEPAFTKITTQTFVEAGLRVPSSLVKKLLAPFWRR